MADYERFVGAVLAEARSAGAELRYWSPWNEPNHPYFISPQRQECSRSAPSAAVEPYVEMARALARALDAAPGDQQLVLGELAGLDERRPMTTSVSEFVARIPKELACASPIWTQHGYVGGRDLADDLERALERKGCARPEQIWITETGVGAPRSGEKRRTTRPPRSGPAGGCTAGSPAGTATRASPPPSSTRSARTTCSRPGSSRPTSRRRTPRSPSGTPGAWPPARSRPPRRRRTPAPSLTPLAPGRVARRMRLYDYAASGNCFKVRLLLALLGRTYERVPVDIFAGDTLTDAYAAINPLRETPVLELDAGERLAQSAAILWCLAEGTPFLPADAFERAQVAQWLSFEQERVMGGLGDPRFRLLTGRGRPGCRRGWRPAATRSTVLDAHLAGREWVVGDAADDRRPRAVPYISVAGDAGLSRTRRRRRLARPRPRAAGLRRRLRHLSRQRPAGRVALDLRLQPWLKGLSL